MNKLQRVLCLTFIFIAIVFSGTRVYAKSGILSNVVISDKQNSGYEITLNTNKPVKYSIKKQNDDRIIIKLKGITPANTADAIYKNASNIEHIMIKPIMNATVIEINGKNAAKSIITTPSGTVQKTNNPVLASILVVSIVSAIILINKRKRNKFSTHISVKEEENKILKVAFERKGGLIAKSTGAKNLSSQQKNIRKVNFKEDYDTKKELSLK